MLRFVDFSQAGVICEEQNINRFVIPLSLDTMTENAMYKAMTVKYPELDDKFKEAIAGKSLKPNDVIRVQLPSGQIIFFYIARMTEKFQAYLPDITTALDKIIQMIRREAGDNLAESKLLVPLPGGDDFKLADSIIVPAILNCINVKGLPVFAVSNGDHEKYVESVTEDAVYFKRDSLQSDWMLTEDDILFVEIMARTVMTTHSYKISRSSLAKCYYIAHENGLYPKLEFYDSPYGKAFKAFMPKSMGLMNHGLILNTLHYTKMTPPKTSFVMGPSYPLFKHMAYTRFANNTDKINAIAAAIFKEYLNSYKEKNEFHKSGENQSHGEYRKPAESTANTFSL